MQGNATHEIHYSNWGFAINLASSAYNQQKDPHLISYAL
jgi:hypothetical protein